MKNLSTWRFGTFSTGIRHLLRTAQRKCGAAAHSQFNFMDDALRCRWLGLPH
jgi:hypothetical protein